MRARTAALVGASAATLAIAVPALAATTVNEKLVEYKISGASSAPAGTVTFRATNSGEDEHELVVIKTTTRASKLKVNEEGEASEKGRRGKITVAAGKTKSLKLRLSKGHYALICNIGDHYTSGMRKDFTVR